jgi:hypothetical protein
MPSPPATASADESPRLERKYLPRSRATDKQAEKKPPEIQERGLADLGGETGPSGAGAVVEVVIWTQCRDQAGLVVLHYVVSQVQGVMPSWSVIAHQMSLTFADLFKQVLSIQAGWQGVGVKEIHPAPSTIIWDNTATGVGTVGTIHAPRQLCGLIRKYVAGAFKGNRGRSYIPFPPSDFTADGLYVTAGYLATLQAIATAMDGQVFPGDGVNSATLTPCLWSRKNRIVRVLISTRAEKGIATQRRRGDYGRTNVPPVEIQG